jgi:hypothetical protein
VIARLILIQLVLPLWLIGWLAFAPSRGTVGLTVQAISTALVILAVAWAGMWLFPPWWTPFLLAVLWASAIGLALRPQRRPRLAWPQGLRAWVSTGLLLLLGAYAGWAAMQAYRGRQLAPVPVAEVSSPLRGGPYLVLSGGSTEMVNSHVRTLNPSSARAAAYRGQSYGLDIVKVDAFGLRTAGLRPSDPAAYHIFGEPLFAPCDGTVLQAVDGLDDLPVPETDLVNRAGNHVVLACGDAVLLIAHMRRGSLTVSRGQ